MVRWPCLSASEPTGRATGAGGLVDLARDGSAPVGHNWGRCERRGDARLGRDRVVPGGVPWIAVADHSNRRGDDGLPKPATHRSPAQELVSRPRVLAVPRPALVAGLTPSGSDSLQFDYTFLWAGDALGRLTSYGPEGPARALLELTVV